MPKFSVIIPIYNVAQYLSETIECVLNQTCGDFEMLLVDDGSTDGSEAICDSYAQKDSRVRVFHKENGGVSSARNLGLEAAEGEWVTFLDGDDLFAKDTLELINNSMSNHVSMIYGVVKGISYDGREFEMYGSSSGVRLLTQKGAMSDFLPYGKVLHRSLGGRFFRMSEINKHCLKYNTNIHYKEDGLFIVQYICRCDGMYLSLPNAYYIYRQHPTSAMNSLETRTFNEDRFLTNIDAHTLILAELKSFGFSFGLVWREKKAIFSSYHWMLGKFSGCDENHYKRVKNDLFKKAVHNISYPIFVAFAIFRGIWISFYKIMGDNSEID